MKKESPIKVLQVLPILGYGGVEKMVMRYFDAMDHKQIMFDYVAHGEYEPYHDELIKQGCKIYYLPTIGKAGYWEYRKKVKSEIKLDEYEIIHIHIGWITGLYASVYRSLCNVKIICHAHTTRCLSPKMAFLMPLFRLMARKNANYLLACGNEAGKFCFGNANYEIIHNALSFNDVKSVTNESVEKLRKEFSIEDDVKIVGHVGHFSEPKNHRFLTDIIHDYVKVDKKVKFFLIGDGPDKKMIEDLVSQNGDKEYVVFTGVRSDVLGFMKLFDVFVLPSLHEGLPLVGIEAQAVGTPCIFSDTIDELVDVGLSISEFLSIENGTRSWVETINRKLYEKNDIDDEKIYASLCKSGYEINVSAKKLLEIYMSEMR